MVTSVRNHPEWPNEECFVLVARFRPAVNAISVELPSDMVAMGARIDAADAQVEADIARFDSVVLDALRGTETALETYARGRDRAQALDRAAASAQLSADQAGKLFRFGRSDFLSLLSAQGALASARVNQAQAEAALVDRQIAVFLALGGGWQQAPANGAS